MSNDTNWGPKGSPRTKKQKMLAVVSITAIIAIGAGAGIGFATGAASNAQSITDANAFTTFNLPSVPQGFTAQSVIDGTPTDTAIGEYDKAAAELSAALSTTFGLTFSDPSAAVANPMFTSDGKTPTLVQQVTGKTYTAVNQTIKSDVRTSAIDTINSIITKYGFNPYVAAANPNGTNPLASGYVNISGQSAKLPGDRFAVEIIDNSTPGAKSVTDSPTVQAPVQTVVVYFTSYPHLNKADTQKFRDAVTSDYKRYLDGSLPKPATQGPVVPRVKEDTGTLQ